MSAPELCITPECGRRRKSRGLCGACFQAFLDAKRRGELTDEEAIKLGFALPPYGNSRGKLGLFMRSVRSKLDEIEKDGAK